MNNEIKEGLVYYIESMVEDGDTAIYFGSGNVNVFGTPAMIGLMESASSECVQRFLPPELTSVGTEINVKHFKASPLGMKVYIKAELVKIEEKKLFFEVSARDENGEIGSGTHTRYIVNQEEFMGKLDTRS